MKSLLLILLFPITLQAQTVSVSPMSFKAWGSVDDVSSVAISHYKFGLHFFHSSESQDVIALSYQPKKFLDFFEPGIIVASHNFPVAGSNNVNFIVSAGYSYDVFKISYNHISSGLGVFNKINPGVDFISISYTIP